MKVSTKKVWKSDAGAELMSLLQGSSEPYVICGTIDRDRALELRDALNDFLGLGEPKSDVELVLRMVGSSKAHLEKFCNVINGFKDECPFVYFVDKDGWLDRHEKRPDDGPDLGEPKEDFAAILAEVDRENP